MRPLSQRENIILAICLLCVFVFLIITFLVKPIKNVLSDLDDQIASQEKQLYKSYRLIQKARKIEPRYKYYMERFRRIGTDEEIVSKIIAEIEKNANQTGIHISELKPQKRKKSGSFDVFPISLMFECPLQDMIQFFDILQKDPNYLGIEELSINRNQDRTSYLLQVNVILTKIYVP